MRALLDEMIPPAVAEQLRQRGHDVIAVTERADLRSLPDREIFALAQAEGRAIVTRDRADYLALDRDHRAAENTHAGLILVPSRFASGSIAPLVKALDQLLRVDAPYSGFVQWL